ncbi:PREDICTED: uncharacterized protein LOC109132905 [Camelina sativa]|uniref:Uncharacterized protein LOC109132905 n=1 Tax=Camelina sativa TaxID=90675 RepID=A0ABM1RPH6_CAMSA|nr:PREDICTED: uncharacterized protein LOC109132905 [Camelina sativa]
MAADCIGIGVFGNNGVTESSFTESVEENRGDSDDDEIEDESDNPEGLQETEQSQPIQVKRNSDNSINKFKARLVAKSYVQRHGVDFDEVFAPVAHIETIRFLIALSASNGWEVHHLDVKTAFLHGELREDVFITQPEGFITDGFYVDDLLITGSSLQLILEFKKDLSRAKGVTWSTQVLPIEAFSDPANGFILEGEEHEFGAHVKIAPSPVAAAENLPFHKFSWSSVRDFSLLKQSDYVSKTFQMGEKSGETLTVYPKGDSRAEGELSSYVHLAEGENLSKGELIMVRARLQILDPRGSNHLSGWLQSWVMTSNKGRGLTQSMPLAKIQEGYLDHEDTLNVEMECEIVNAIKNNPLF